MKSRSISNPAGQPSIIPPIAFPCDSPKEVSLKICPKLFMRSKMRFVKTKNVVPKYEILKQHLTNYLIS
jgi:hypothetical protein